MHDSHREVFNLPALRLGQGLVGSLLVAVGASWFIVTKPAHGSISFPLFALGIGTLFLVYTVFLWKPGTRALVFGLYMNAFAALLGVLIGAYNAAMLGSGGHGAIGAMMLSQLVMIVSGGLGSSFNKLRKSGVSVP